MKILQLTPKPPVPAVDGGTLAMNAVAEGLLRAGHEVKVLCISTRKHPFLPEKISPDYKSKTAIEAVFVNTGVRIFPALANLFSKSSYNVDRFFSAAFEKRLTEILEQEKFDVVQVESLYMMPYFESIRKHSDARIILRAHNVESKLWQRRTALEKSPWKKKWFSHLTANLSAYENNAFLSADAVMPITPEDKKTIEEITGTQKPVMVIPFAMELPERSAEASPKPFTVFHIGAMDWEPNIEGVHWMIKKVWPLVLEKIPHAELHLAGRDLDKEDLRYYGQNIFVHGEVENAFSFMNEYAVMTAPLLTGGGMRVKLVEGMALAKPIVTTTIGAEGISASHEKQAMICDSPEEFATAICQLLNNPIFAREMGNRAKDFAKTNFETGEVSRKLTDFYHSLLQ